jgi:hypothetical protein
MTKVGSAVMIAAVLGFALPAEAQVAVDVQVGYAVPVGNIQHAGPVVSGDWPMSSWWSGAIPIGVAGRYRFTPNLSAGVYFQWSPAFVASAACGPGASCSGYDMRAGLELVYGIIPDGKVNPWLSLGMGWAWSQAASTIGGTLNVNGWELPAVQVGVDFALSRAFALGPYLGFVGGTYTNLTFGRTWAVDPSIRSYHGWFQVGVKGTIDL